jgi:lactoylglutathione lyase
MKKPNISPAALQRGCKKEIAHFAISVGGKDIVNELTELPRRDNYTIFRESRTTNDACL